VKLPRYARISARLLAAAPEVKVEVTDSQRARAIEAISGALAAKTRRRVKFAWALASVAGAAAAVLVYFAIQPEVHPPSVATQTVSAVVVSSGTGNAITNQGGTQPLVSAAALPQGGHLVAGASGGATVRLSSGTELSVEHDTNVEFEDAGPVQRFFLGQGVLQAKVAKLTHEQRFIVRTPDAEIEVRGTVFRVEIVDPDAPCAEGRRTRVTVSEGLVEVRGAGASTYVHPGESWPPDCATPRPALSQPTHVAGPSHAEPAPATLAAGSSAASGNADADPDTAPPPAAGRSGKELSSIAQQNELFAAAAAQSRSGDREGALGSFEALLRRYPQSPLAESAAVQRMRLLEASNPSAARSAARQYLARYPQGYARTDAARIAQP
jgi:ferric-dicitrate binding protein FerR (iron transport regulator)